MNTKLIKQVVLCVIWALVTVPLALILTFMLRPFWDWFEAISGIESLGHSGPSEWCYIAIYVALVSGIVILHRTRKRRF
jgi:hypothetical protein